MFESLDDHMKHDDQEETSRTQRTLKWAVVAAASVLLFGGLYMGIRLLQ
jgi:hypothetical protein